MWLVEIRGLMDFFDEKNDEFGVIFRVGDGKVGKILLVFVIYKRKIKEKVLQYIIYYFILLYIFEKIKLGGYSIVPEIRHPKMVDRRQEK